MTDGTAVQLALILGLRACDRWRDERGVNIFDGAAPFYRTYRCADGGFMAVGCVEPGFYAATLRVLGLTDDPLFARQHEQANWPAMSVRMAELFATRTRADWTAAFDGQSACVTPVLSVAEAAAHPHNAHRATFGTFSDGHLAPAPAPRFLGTPAADPRPAPVIGAHTDEVLAEFATASRSSRMSCAPRATSAPRAASTSTTTA